MSLPVYLDYAATTPVDPEVAAAMSACLTMDGVFANPASRSHVYGWQAEEKVEEARGRLAALFCCDAREWVWTSGATESNNLALKGVFEARQFQGHLITSRVEHKAVPGVKEAVYTLIVNSGAFPPIEKRVRVVYDQNKGEIVHTFAVGGVA